MRPDTARTAERSTAGMAHRTARPPARRCARPGTWWPSAPPGRHPGSGREEAWACTKLQSRVDLTSPIMLASTVRTLPNHLSLSSRAEALTSGCVFTGVAKVESMATMAPCTGSMPHPVLTESRAACVRLCATTAALLRWSSGKKRMEAGRRSTLKTVPTQQVPSPPSCGRAARCAARPHTACLQAGKRGTMGCDVQLPPAAPLATGKRQEAHRTAYSATLL